MTALQQIIKEAKILRKKNPKIEWKKAVAQASAIYASKHKGKSPVGKKKSAKKVGVVKHKKVAKKKKISEQGILNRIHKVKHDVERLDKAQHKHMSMSGMRNINVIKEIESTKDLIVEQTELLDRLQKAYKKSVSKINKQMIMLDIKTLKNNFIPHNKRYLKQLQSLLKKSI
jgi:hypothetical protein